MQWQVINFKQAKEEITERKSGRDSLMFFILWVDLDFKLTIHSCLLITEIVSEL